MVKFDSYDTTNTPKQGLEIVQVNGKLFETKMYYAQTKEVKGGTLLISKRPESYRVIKIYGGKPFSNKDEITDLINNICEKKVNLSEVKKLMDEDIVVSTIDGKLIAKQGKHAQLEQQADGCVHITERDGYFRLFKVYDKNFSNMKDAQEWMNEQR